ncbi:MAG TPA: 4-alpha-glucanotransferase, partial [Chthoniobacterales bacterium]
MHLNPEKKIAGVLAPVFALRSATDLGVGDVACLRDLVDWAAETGFRIVQILPINETGGDNSPYNAISSVALDITTLEISPKTIPDLTAASYRAVLKQFDLVGLRRGAVNYTEVKKLKHALLNKAFARFVTHEEKVQSARAGEFANFCESQHTWLGDYAFFRVL